MQLIEKLKGPEFEKMAAKVLLGDNPATYPSELIANLYKQHPYLGKYQVNISIEGQDPSMGYMYGVFMVSHASDVPPEPGVRRMGEVISQGQSQAPDPAKSIRIPIIVENKRAYSFDVFINTDGRFLPLNEARVSSSLFEATPFAMAPNPDPTQAAGSNQTMPVGAEGREAPMNATTKMASAVFSKVHRDDVKNFVEGISKVAELKNAYDLNPVFSASLHSLVENSVERPKEKVAGFDFTSAVVTKADGGFNIKTSNDLDFQDSVWVSNQEAEKTLPVEVRQQVIKTGSALMSPAENPGLDDLAFTENLSGIEDTGVYAVMTKTGKAQKAVVIKGVTRIDGTKSDSCVIVGESGASYQEKVAGVRYGDLDLSGIDGSEPSGDGVFIIKSAGIVTEPVEVLYSVEENGEKTYTYAHPLRGVGRLKVASVKGLVNVDDSTQMIAEDFAFVPLTFGARYSSDATAMDKIASRRDYINGVSLIADGSEYNFRGARIDETKLTGLSHHEALLALSDMGDTADGAYAKTAEARKGRTPKFVVKLATKKEATSGEAGEIIDITNMIRENLVKEASTLRSQETVDSVLSLNFITPENVAGYIDALPSFEESVSKLAELLVGVRLGLSDVPEAAVSSSLNGLERAIGGLKKLQIRSNMIG